MKQGGNGAVDMIGYPLTSELTQGTIFTCAASENYTDACPHGLVITARCDILHSKAPVISYVPLIGFRAWLFRDGLRLLASRVVAACQGTMKDALRQAGLAESMFDTVSPQTLRKCLAEMPDKAGRNAAKRYTDAETRKELANAALKAMPGAKAALDFVGSQSKDYQHLLRELLSNGISDYHYVDCSEPGEDCEGYVALFREIRYLPIALADELKNGIDFEAFQFLCQRQPQYADKLTIKNGDQYALPVGVIKSPFIELFMQRFTSLYARIGVTDYSPNLMKTLSGIVQINIGDAQ